MFPVDRYVTLRILLHIYYYLHNLENFLSGMKVRSLLFGGIFWVEDDILYVSVCGSADFDHLDGKRWFQSFC